MGGVVCRWAIVGKALIGRDREKSVIERREFILMGSGLCLGALGGCVTTGDVRAPTSGNPAKANSIDRNMSPIEADEAREAMAMFAAVNSRPDKSRLPVGKALRLQSERLLRDIEAMPVVLSDREMVAIGNRIRQIASLYEAAATNRKGK